MPHCRKQHSRVWQRLSGKKKRSIRNALNQSSLTDDQQAEIKTLFCEGKFAQAISLANNYAAGKKCLNALQAVSAASGDHKYGGDPVFA